MELESGYHPLPQPDDIPDREKEDAMGAYLMMFAAVAVALPLPVINLIAAVIYYYVNRSKSRYVHFHALQSLWSQLPTTLINWGVLFWSVRIFLFNLMEPDELYYGYLVMAVIANLLYFIFSIIAAIKSRKGQFYYFLFFGKLSYEQIYSVRNRRNYDNEAPQPDAPAVNAPPKL